MSNAHIHGCEVVQLVLVCTSRLTAGKIVSHVGKMEEKGDGIDEEDGPNSRGGEGVAQKVRRDDAAVGVGDENALRPLVLVEDGEDIGAHFSRTNGRVSDAKAYRHDFDSDDADLAII